MEKNGLPLIAHLLRRAGFGAGRDELEQYAAMGYGAVVEDLLHPERYADVDEDVLHRYYLELNNRDTIIEWKAVWVYRMINTRRPLQEKLALFWHHIFATSTGKSEHGTSAAKQIETFRRNCLSDMRTILMDLATDPAMIHWLDNSENHSDEPNENWGRELLELFSMGVGNYTEQDIKMAARAFTGWTFTQPIPLDPYGRYNSQFLYRDDDHDSDVKTFLGETGRFNGGDIIDIVARQPATARFISRHLYNFFVADESQVAAWNQAPPQDPEAIGVLVNAYLESDGDIRSILRVLFNSDFFKQARFKRVKSPAELVAGTIKLTGTHRFPDRDLLELDATTVMGQSLMQPPTVEGWHTGTEWIDGGTLNERVNFAVNQMGDSSKPGIRAIIDRLRAEGRPLSAEEFVEGCLDLAGPLDVDAKTRDGLMEYAESGGELRFDTEAHEQEGSARIVRMLQLIVSSIDYQFA